MLGKILVALLVAAGVFLVYSLFAGKANAATNGTVKTSNKWLSGANVIDTITKTNGQKVQILSNGLANYVEARRGAGHF